jgi:outer membrane protein TolC
MWSISPFPNTTRRSSSLFGATACLAVLFVASRTPAQTTEARLTVRVCRSGPARATARAERDLGAAEVRAIQPVQNPSLVLEHQRTLTGPNDRETTVGSEIPLPISGRRGLLRHAAEARQLAANARADLDLLQTALDFREAYALAVVDHERAAVMQAHQKALEELSVALRQLSKSGETAAYDVKRHEVEVRLHSRALTGTLARAERSERRLHQWLGEGIGRNSLSSAGLSRAPLALRPSIEHPEVAALYAMGRAAGLESDAARRRWVPEPEIFAGYRQISTGAQTGHGLRVAISLPLTFFEHGQGASARALAERTLARDRAGRLRRELDVELEAVLATLEPLEAAFRAAELNLKAAEQLREQARVLYEAGEASMTDLLDAYRTGESAALDRVTALEELLAARLAAMRAAGTQFDPELDGSCGSLASKER